MPGRGSARLLALLLAVLFAVALSGPALAGVQPWHFTGVERVVVFPDVHGEFDGLVDLLTEAEVIDEQLRWAAGKTHLVSLGDLVDRGARSRDVLELLMRLEREAAKAGGRVHVLPGNHEAMNVLGDLRYVAWEEYDAFAAEETAEMRDAAFEGYVRWLKIPLEQREEARTGFDQLYVPGFFAHRAAFSPEGRYGKWILQRPTIIVIDDLALVHGGLSPLVTMLGPAEVNERLPREIEEHLALWEKLSADGIGFPATGFSERFSMIKGLLEREAETGKEIIPRYLRPVAERLLATSKMLAVREDGPLWYRGTARNFESDEAPVLEAALERLGASRVVVGHTLTPDHLVNTRFGGRVVMLDSGMLESAYAGRPAAFIATADSTRVLYGDSGRTELLEVLVAREHEELTDEEAERFLLTARVVEMKEIGTGISRPQRITLELDGLRLRAAFKTIDQEFRNTVKVGRQWELGFTDRYAYERAAYLVDRELGLGLVPVTVLREIDGTPGSLQMWVEGGVDEAKRLTMKTPEFEYQQQLDLLKARMRVFDALIENTDRNQGNMLYTTHDWQLHLIDHSRSFGMNRKLPESLQDAEIEVDREFATRLEALDQETLPPELLELLSRARIKTMLKRRDKLLERLKIVEPAPREPAVVSQ